MQANTSQTMRSFHDQPTQQESFIFEDDAGDIVEFEDPYEDVDVDKILMSFEDELEALFNRWKKVESNISLAFEQGRSMAKDGTPSRHRGTPNTSRKANSHTPSYQNNENQTMSAFNSATTRSNIATNDEKYETPRIPIYTTYTTASKAPYSIKDPPPSAARHSPLRNYVDSSTPVRRENAESSARSYSTRQTVETPAEPPPAPMETPYPASYATPNRQRGERPQRAAVDPQDDILSQLKAALDAQQRKVESLEHENQVLKEQLYERSENGRDRLLFASEFGSITSNLRLDLDENAVGTTTTNVKNTPPAQAPPPPSPINPRRDNNYELLDERNRRHHRTMDSTGLAPSIPRREDNDGGYSLPPKHDHRPREAYEPVGRRPVDTSQHDDVSSYRPSPMSTPARNPASPPKRVHISSGHGRSGASRQSRHEQTRTTTLVDPEMRTEEVWVTEGLSRGTRFVAKLSTLMDVQPGEQTPMSVLVDKHWDELKHFFETSG